MKPKQRRPVAELSVLALLLSSSLATAGADEPGFAPIFNGKDLSGWRQGDADLAGKAASADGRFAVRDGVLVISGSNDRPPRMAEIDTAEDYDGDFTLRLEFRASRDANSGLHLRDKAFPHQLQIRDYPRVGPYKALRNYNDGGWNAIEVAVAGDKARCTCNGEVLESALAIPEKGPLSLQSEINVVEYRNIRVRREDRPFEVRRDIPYASPAQERQVLDVYSPKGAKGRPVVFWIHGGGWVVGDKSDVQAKPRAFTEKGFVFVSTNYRLLPKVDMGTIVRDVAAAIRWVHDHIAEHGGDPRRLLVMGHSAGAQLAALVSIDDRYLKEQGLSLDIIKGCVPVDGDTYDVPAIIETAETRCRAHGFPLPTNGHRQKFGNDPEKHRDLSAVTHVAAGKGIPPFLIMHVAGHPDTTAQAQRLAAVLKGANVPVRVYGAPESTHSKLNDDIGVPGDPGTKALFEFVDGALKR
ncbi:Carboxylesterase [Aquisphaera giovannonii]|uniref:Carboxylesterase n=1 Tax=Aquisphaera giovannonii TaxID=406548 RepID=A0A5B9W402_9BACT|nr:alpha/beta hydrolase fold domain-containing protein [Aquisphaera giovannonii]QEH35346.1 Carboxylesterase [Aquisphaera giovannonii]